MRVLEQAKSKIERYDGFDNEKRNRKYNKAYHDLLRVRGVNSCLVDENGGASDSTLSIVESTLIAFEMKKYGQIDDQFKERLRGKLEDQETRNALKNFREYTILRQDVKSLRPQASFFFERLAEENGLDARGYRFGVGAAKTMNFLFPELFVMMDSLVMCGLGLDGIPNFENYGSIMITCQDELQEWRRKFGDLESLIRLDEKPTTLTRIFDKCAFAMGLEKRNIR